MLNFLECKCGHAAYSSLIDVLGYVHGESSLLQTPGSDIMWNLIKPYQYSSHRKSITRNRNKLGTYSNQSQSIVKHFNNAKFEMLY